MTLVRATAATTRTPPLAVCAWWETLASSMLKGRDFFSRKRTTPSASSRFEGRVSKSSHATREEASGKIAITSRERPPMLSSEPCSARKTASRCFRFASIMSGTTTPGESSCDAQASTVGAASETRPASTRSAAISQAILGLDDKLKFGFQLSERSEACNLHAHSANIQRTHNFTRPATRRNSDLYELPSRVYKEQSRLVTPLAHGLNERDFVDFLQRGQSRPDLVERGLAQKAHTFLPRRAPDFRSRLLAQNHFANAVAQVQQFMDGCASAEARPRAFNATLPFIEGNLRPLLRVETAGHQHVGSVMHRGAAVLANQPDQTLRQNAVQRGNKVVGLHTHVEKASDHVHDVVGVNGGEHQ